MVRKSMSALTSPRFCKHCLRWDRTVLLDRRTQGRKCWLSFRVWGCRGSHGRENSGWPVTLPLQSGHRERRMLGLSCLLHAFFSFSSDPQPIGCPAHIQKPFWNGPLHNQRFWVWESHHHRGSRHPHLQDQYKEKDAAFGCNSFIYQRFPLTISHCGRWVLSQIWTCVSWWQGKHPLVRAWLPDKCSVIVCFLPFLSQSPQRPKTSYRLNYLGKTSHLFLVNSTTLCINWLTFLDGPRTSESWF